MIFDGELDLNILLDNKFFVLYLAPFLLGGATIFSFEPFSFTFINFLTFPAFLYLIFEVKKKMQSKYRKKKSNKYFFYLGCAFGFGFFFFGNYWISISLTHDDMFKGLIPFTIVLIPLFLSLFLGLTTLIVGIYSEQKIHFVLFFSLVFAVIEFMRGTLLSGFPWNLISYTWSWSPNFIQILSIIGTYSLSLISITFFCLPFLFFQKKIFKKNIIFTIVFFAIFICNYLYGMNKITNSKYKFDKDISVKIISPNFSLEDYNSQQEIDTLERLIKISDPEKSRKTLFIWPEGIFYESYLKEIKQSKFI